MEKDNEEEKFKRYLRMLNEENSIDKKEEAMLGLLDLYYKQQKEIEELKSQLEFIGEQNNYISRLEKEIKLMKSININDNYISKDKIKNKIKELEETMKQDEVDEFGIHSIGWSVLDYVVEQLKELLEE